MGETRDPAFLIDRVRSSTSHRARSGLRVPVMLAMLSGALYGMALAPDAPPILAWLALAPLFAACAQARPPVAALCGAIYAVVATALLASWFPGMLQSFFGLTPAGSWLGWLALAVLVNGLPYALLGAWLAWRRRRAAPSPLLVGAGWLAAEWLRVHGPVPNPYALLATSQVGTPFAQSADALGVLGVGAVVAIGGACLAAIAVPGLRGPRPARDLPLAAGVVAVVFAYGSWRGGLHYGDGELVRVTLVQPASTPYGDGDGSSRALERLLALTGSAEPADSRLVFWPESAVDFYLRESGGDRNRVFALASTPRTELILGGPHYRYGEPSADYFASAFLVRDGRVAGRYDKRRLVPFAEYAPLGAWLPAAATLRPGARSRPLPATGAAVGAFLCGEVLFPEVARELSLAGATLLANPSNDDWFGAEAPARHQLHAAALRAIENRRPLVRPTRSGYSAVIDARGRPVAVSAFGVAQQLEARVEPSSATTFHQRAGFALAPASAGLAILAASRPRRRHPGGTRS
jgi:apolipoprotein N-acyltransferase